MSNAAIRAWREHEAGQSIVWGRSHALGRRVARVAHNLRRRWLAFRCIRTNELSSAPRLAEWQIVVVASPHSRVVSSRRRCALTLPRPPSSIMLATASVLLFAQPKHVSTAMRRVTAMHHNNACAGKSVFKKATQTQWLRWCGRRQYLIIPDPILSGTTLGPKSPRVDARRTEAKCWW